MPDNKRKFHLYLHNSGSSLYQIQNGQPRLIEYVSKRMPTVVQNYSIPELELCRLAINIARFSHLFKKVDSDAVVDHLALTFIIRSKSEKHLAGLKGN